MIAEVALDECAEEWRPIADASGYEVSSHGRVRSLRHNPPLIMRPAKDRDGYLRVGLRLGGKPKRPVAVSRLVCCAFNGGQPESMPICAHNNGNRTDNRPQNLRWATAKDNERDKYAHGTMHFGLRNGANRHPETRRGVRNSQAKLSEGDVLAIRLSSLSSQALASLYAVSERQIRNIQERKAWRHI